MQAAFNTDELPKAEDIRPCTPFTASMTIEGLLVTECTILSVPDSLNLSQKTSPDNDSHRYSDASTRNLSQDYDGACCSVKVECDDDSFDSSDLSELPQDNSLDYMDTDKKLDLPLDSSADETVDCANI